MMPKNRLKIVDMSYTSIKMVTVAIAILLHLNASATDSDLIELKVRLPKVGVVSAKDFVLEIQLKSYKQEPLIFYKYPEPGFVVRQMGALCIQVQSKAGTSYVDIPDRGSIDSYSDGTDTIKSGEVRSYELPITMMYHQLPRGTYRVRILLAFSLLNLRVENKFSNWVYFKCEKDIDETLGPIQMGFWVPNRVWATVKFLIPLRNHNSLI